MDFDENWAFGTDVGMFLRILIVKRARNLKIKVLGKNKKKIIFFGSFLSFRFVGWVRIRGMALRLCSPVRFETGGVRCDRTKAEPENCWGVELPPSCLKAIWPPGTSTYMQERAKRWAGGVGPSADFVGPSTPLKEIPVFFSKMIFGFSNKDNF